MWTVFVTLLTCCFWIAAVIIGLITLGFWQIIELRVSKSTQFISDAIHLQRIKKLNG